MTTESGEAVQDLDQCLDSVMGWMRANKLKLNPGKTEALWVRGSRVRETGSLPVLDGVALPLKDQVRSSGVLRGSSGHGGSECLVPASAGTPTTASPGQG